MPKLLIALFLFSAAAALAQPEVTSWDILQQGIADTNPDHRRQAVTAAGSIGVRPEAVKMVERGLRDDDPGIRQVAAALLGQMKSTTSIPALKAALDDPSGEVAFTAAKSLWEMGDHAGEEVLQEVLTGQQKSNISFVDGAMRDAKAKLRDRKALALMGAKEAAGAVLGPFSIGITAAQELMKDSGATGRTVAAQLLSDKCDSRNLQLLEWSLASEKNNIVKAAIAKAIGRCGNQDDIPRLEGYLSNSNLVLRYMVAASIIKLSPQ